MFKFKLVACSLMLFGAAGVQAADSSALATTSDVVLKIDNAVGVLTGAINRVDVKLSENIENLRKEFIQISQEIQQEAQIRSILQRQQTKDIPQQVAYPVMPPEPAVYSASSLSSHGDNKSFNGAAGAVAVHPVFDSEVFELETNKRLDALESKIWKVAAAGVAAGVGFGVAATVIYFKRDAARDLVKGAPVRK